jgi:cyclopropane-fatty-acyl-phospholipid synthase
MATESLAPKLKSLLESLLQAPISIRLRAWDGSEAGPAESPVLVFHRRRALRRLMWQPNELGLARAYVSGELDLEGDLYDALDRLAALIWRASDLRGLPIRAVAGDMLRLGVVGTQPKPPPEEIAMAGARHSRRRDRQAISHHYDVGNDFYRIVLGPSMVYSCAYWTSADPGYGLGDAQRDKLDMISRKLGLQPGMRLLDVGCGWGSMAMHAAREYGVRVLGITLSTEQAEYARKQVAEAGLTDQVEIRIQDYRDLDDGPFDAISSIGMAEHVGIGPYREYASTLLRQLKPGGRLLNHQIAAIHPEPKAAEWSAAVRLVGAGRARVWRLYMAASALAFERGRIGVNQVLAIRAHRGGASDMSPTRSGWLQ